jgi:hypothetical protein|tara:strand:+ start:3443 stop:4243 length:801 start_codon:yes stop_codon:yes gene_type:complete
MKMTYELRRTILNDSIISAALMSPESPNVSILNALSNTFDMAINEKPEDTKWKSHLKHLVRTDRGSYVEGLNDLNSTVEYLMKIAIFAEEKTPEEINQERPKSALNFCRYFVCRTNELTENRKSVAGHPLYSEDELENFACEIWEAMYVSITDPSQLTDEEFNQHVKVRRVGGEMEFYIDTTYQLIEDRAYDILNDKSPLYITNELWIIVGPTSKEDSTPVIYTWHPGKPVPPLSETTKEELKTVTIKLIGPAVSELQIRKERSNS